MYLFKFFIEGLVGKTLEVGVFLIHIELFGKSFLDVILIDNPALDFLFLLLLLDYNV